MATNTNKWKVGETVRLPRAERLLKKGFSASYETFIDSRYICIREATDRQQGVLVKVLDKTHTEETEVVGGQLYTIDETDQLFDSYKYLCYQFPSAADVKEVLSIIRGDEPSGKVRGRAHAHKSRLHVLGMRDGKYNGFPEEKAIRQRH